MLVVVVVVTVVVMVVVVVVAGSPGSSRLARNSRQALKIAASSGLFKQVWLLPPMQLQPVRYLPGAPQQLQLHKRNVLFGFVEFGTT